MNHRRCSASVSLPNVCNLVRPCRLAVDTVIRYLATASPSLVRHLLAAFAVRLSAGGNAKCAQPERGASST